MNESEIDYCPAKVIIR